MIREHDRVVLSDDLPEQNLKRGDIGTVVHVHCQGQAFEVEFVTLDGCTVCVATLRSEMIRPIQPQEIAHARLLAG